MMTCKELISNIDFSVLIWEFLAGEWIYVAPVSKNFRTSYARYHNCYTYYSNAFVTTTRLIYAVENGLDLKCRCDLCFHAGKFGSKETLKLAKKFGLPFNVGLCDAAAAAGKFETLIWLHVEHRCPWNMYLIRKEAVRHGNYELLCWIQSQKDMNLPVNEELCRIAAANGHEHILEYLLNEGRLWERRDNLCIDACSGGHVSTFQWLCRKGFPVDGQLCAEAAIKSGRHYMLSEIQNIVGSTEWFYPRAQIDSVISGSSSALHYMKALGLGAWTAGEMSALLREGLANRKTSLDAVRWLIRNGAKMSLTVPSLAELATLSGGNFSVLQLGIEENLPWGRWSDLEIGLFDQSASIKVKKMVSQVNAYEHLPESSV